VEDFCQNR
jgi:hypothetical protein